MLFSVTEAWGEGEVGGREGVVRNTTSGEGIL